jgi:hypothetical protein
MELFHLLKTNLLCGQEAANVKPATVHTFKKRSTDLMVKLQYGDIPFSYKELNEFKRQLHLSPHPQIQPHLPL